MMLRDPSLLSRRPMGRLAMLAAAVGLAGLAGCGVYTNIPPQRGDVAGHDPNPGIVASVAKVSLQAVARHLQVIEPYRFTLPDGATPQTYALLNEQLGTAASEVSTDDLSSGPPLLEVMSIRIRGWTAKVDVVGPASADVPGSGRGLITVRLNWNVVDQWHVQGLRPWRIRVEDALIQSMEQVEEF